jgi:hypothetical protein
MTWHWLKGAFGGGEAVGGASGNDGGGATGGGNDGAEYGQLQLHAR